MHPMSDHFRECERRLHEILASVEDALTLHDREMVFEFIEAREYGVALEHIAASLVESSSEVARPALEHILELARMMNIRDPLFTEELPRRVR